MILNKNNNNNVYVRENLLSSEKAQNIDEGKERRQQVQNQWNKVPQME